MILKIFIGLIVVLALFLGYVSTRDGKFRYERSGLINASAEKIFPYISQFKLGAQWSPYEKGLEMPKNYGGVEGQVGSWMEFGPSKSGSGRIEILETISNQMVKLNLHMTAPFEAKNLVTYRLSPEQNGTRFTWEMEGDGGFMGKLMNTLIDCEKMVGGQFTEGINNLKVLIESQNQNTASAESQASQGGSMKLTDQPEIVSVPVQHYIFVEKVGPFQETAKASWDEVHKIAKNYPQLKKTGAQALFKMHPQMIYRAGFILSEKPENIPAGAQYVKFEGGKYSKFTLTGSYMNLGPAWGQTMQNVEKQKIAVRDDFFIENYANDPATTQEDKLISELMIPTK